MWALRCGLAALFLLVAAALVQPGSGFSLAFLNVQVEFPYRGSNFNLVRSAVLAGSLNGRNVPSVVTNGTSWGTYTCSDAGIFLANVILRANNQSLVMDFSGHIDEHPIIAAELVPPKGLYSHVVFRVQAPTEKRSVWNATIVLQ